MFSSYNTPYSKDGYLQISGDNRFSGDGTNSGMDGIYLDSQNSLPRKIGVDKRLGGLVTVYLEAEEHYVIAEGTRSYSLTEEDQENISVVALNGGKWYKKLDTEANQIYLTKEETVCKTLSADFYSGGPDPSEPHHEKQEVEEDVESVTIAAPALQNFPDWTPMGWTENAKGDEAYQSTVAEGGDCTLTEEGKKYYGVYQKEVTLTYDSTDKAITAGISMPEAKKALCYANVHKDEITCPGTDFTLASGPEVSGYTFKGWSEQENGSGTLYGAGTEFHAEKNDTLYAVYEEKGKRTFAADFYSGDPLQIKSESDIRDEDATEGTVTVPFPENITGWTFLGWNKNKGAYTADTDIRSGHTLTLTEEKTEYYGIYETEITLIYNANGGDSTPPEDTQKRYANVHETTGYQDPDFTIAPAIHREGHTFVEWNTKADGSGNRYTAGSRESFTENTTLYAVFLPEGQKQLAADFYSGGANQKETIVNTVEDTVSGADITIPEPKEMAGWTALGWNKSKGAYTADDDIRPGRSLTLTEPLTEYYGIYEKSITLSYDSNGGGEAPVPEKKACYASVHQEITQKYPDFTIAGTIHREGHTFVGWNTEADGTGTSYEPGSTRKLEEDTLLYAVWRNSAAPEPSEPSGPSEPEPSGPDAPAPETVPYRVEYYCQNLTGEEYTRMDSDTETLTGTVGTEAEASRKTYTGFTLNLSHPSGKPKGTVERDGSLVLKLYYDRLIYEVDFSLNGGYGKAPDTQHIRYGGLLGQVSDPLRRGYNFKGWYMDDKGLDGGIWDFGSPVEQNTGTLKTTLYAKWADELAPAMGKASFSRGSRDFLDWLIQKESMVVTVPVTEEGSGLARAEYLLVAEDGTEQDGQAAFTELHTMTDTMAAYGSSAAVLRSIRGEMESGSYEARIAIKEEFKGKVYLTCTDYAGNVSAQKTLTAEGGGVIVEDNAPEIRFDGTKETTGGKPLEVKVEVRDSEEDRVTSGIFGVRYQVDKKKSVSLPEEDFTGDFAEVCEFTVKIKGEGKHTLRVEAEDHAGNESTAEVTLNISGSREVPKEVPADQNPGNPGGPGRTGKPLGGEPQTGDSTQIQICATLAMIAGFGYLLLYFEGENGITEQEKEEMIHRIVTWAKQGGRIRRLLGLAGIFLFLAYYHSIGKSVDVEWKEVYGKN
ncbi:InlB B-repeat-containing protein [Lachnospiraceae bacterium KK002]